MCAPSQTCHNHYDDLKASSHKHTWYPRLSGMQGIEIYGDYFLLIGCTATARRMCCCLNPVTRLWVRRLSWCLSCAQRSVI